MRVSWKLHASVIALVLGVNFVAHSDIWGKFLGCFFLMFVPPWIFEATIERMRPPTDGLR